MSTIIHKEDIDAFRKFDLKKGAELYRELREEVSQAGLLDRSYGFYSTLVACTYIGFFSSLVAIYYTSNPFMVAFLSVLFAIFSVQISGLVHDAAHRAIFKSSKLNDLFGHFLASTVATGYSNWRIAHDRHHAKPNQDGFDPDVEVPFSFTAERFKNSKGLGRRIAKYQAYAYYPLGTLTSLSVRFKKMTYFQENWSWKIWKEVLVFVISVILHFVVPLYLFGLAKGMSFLTIVTLIEGFYLFNVFAPNHKGMPELGNDVSLSFFEQQIVTSRNIRSNSLIDYVYLGLNFQIEHHLFPTAPRNNLKKIVPHVEKLCKKYGIDHTETGPLESAKILFNEMREVSKTFGE
jgi:fatty acid desaturase